MTLRDTDAAPAVSVVLPVYNCPGYVGGAIESVLAQTFRDFELLLIDDGSTDETPSVLRCYVDPRIRLVSQENRGLAATLNRGLGLARGRYVARLDQDDFSYPERLARQVAYMDAHPRCALLGTWAEIHSGDTPTGRAHRHPGDNATLRFELLFNNPFVHSSVMLRRDAVLAAGGYSTDPARQPPEDYELWSRLVRTHEVGNLTEVLHVYREVAGSMSRAGPSPFLDRLVALCAENIAWAGGVAADDSDVRNFAALVHAAPHHVSGIPDAARTRRLLQAAVSRLFPGDQREHFSREMAARAMLYLAPYESPGGARWRGRLRAAAGRAARALGVR